MVWCGGARVCLGPQPTGHTEKADTCLDIMLCVVVEWSYYSKRIIIDKRADLTDFLSSSFVGKMCIFVSRPMKNVTFIRKNGDHPKRVVDFPLERDTFRNKIMEIVKDFDEQSYNNNGKPWKSSRILRVKPNFFIFSLFIIFLHFSFSHFFVFFSFFMFSFFLFFQFFRVLHFSSFFLIFFLHFFLFSNRTATSRTGARRCGERAVRLHTWDVVLHSCECAARASLRGIALTPWR